MSDAMPEPVEPVTEPVAEPVTELVADGRADEAPGVSGGPPGVPGEAPGGVADEPAAAAPLGVARELTGHPAVDARLARLAEVDALPADGHLEVYEDVHRGLRDELTSLDAHPAPRPYDNRS
ncbi:hypothetical protein GCM10010497_33350 [Streptomyces cinereoruber]|uniref:Uncharacterized protein n=1 Tax=Streptomyces cinereoruber TaxID=67260 RepID=A0AAV4KI33_9ACTN|nr:hypothetical protein [Streptomyces cinereoruber]MBB4159157.1 hypothetical protein [Streptomyces cinereoruber]NIH64383.1 hypothetical protein [Streptomyces cinereoruber]GGR28447.1 hypothetical protein GCM10010497_33350 [Streptomyces cinereoruber]